MGFGFIVDIAIRGRTAYIVDAGVDFAIVDLTQLSARSGRFSARSRPFRRTAGRMVFAAAGFGVLRVIDVSTPSLPVNVTNLDLGIDEFFTHTALSRNAFMRSTGCWGRRRPTESSNHRHAPDASSQWRPRGRRR